MFGPMTTRAPARKPVPWIVSAVPPANAPLAGATLVTLGFGGVISSAAGRIARSPDGSVTIRSTWPGCCPAGTWTWKLTWLPNQLAVGIVTSGSLDVRVDPATSPVPCRRWAVVFPETARRGSTSNARPRLSGSSAGTRSAPICAVPPPLTTAAEP